MERLVPLYPDPALLIELGDRRVLVAGDLHVGFEERFREHGVMLPVSSIRMAEKLIAIGQKQGATEIVLLGDVKYSFAGITRGEWEHVPAFLELLSRAYSVTLIPGNHDGEIEPLLPPRVKVTRVDGMDLGQTRLMHGHTIPRIDTRSSHRFVIGHVHPIYNRRGNPLSGSQVWIWLRGPRKPIFDSASDEEEIEVLVMPAFNRELGSPGYAAFHEKNISPVIRRMQDRATAARIVTLNGEIIGDLDSLAYVLSLGEG